MRAVDLFCGMGGWTRGLQDEGFHVCGFDLERLPYSGALAIQDVRTIDGARFRGKIDLVVASPPCQQFTALRLPFRRHRLSYSTPDIELVHAAYRISREAGAPLVLENTMGAVRYLGEPVLRAGAYCLWGDGVPPLVPQIGATKTHPWPKGLRIMGNGKNKCWRASVRGIIPYELARAVGSYHRRRLEAA